MDSEFLLLLVVGFVLIECLIHDNNNIDKFPKMARPPSLFPSKTEVRGAVGVGGCPKQPKHFPSGAPSHSKARRKNSN